MLLLHAGRQVARYRRLGHVVLVGTPPLVGDVAERLGERLLGVVERHDDRRRVRRSVAGLEKNATAAGTSFRTGGRGSRAGDEFPSGQ